MSEEADSAAVKRVLAKRAEIESQIMLLRQQIDGIDMALAILRDDPKHRR